jgi:hypothetical protein
MARAYAYSLHDPVVARRVRATFATMLDSPSGRLSELLVAAMIVQMAERDPLHARIAPAVREHAADLLRLDQATTLQADSVERS